MRVKENAVLDRNKQVAGCRRWDDLFCTGPTESAYRVKETNVLAGLHKLLTVKGNMRGRIPYLCTILGFTFIWCRVHYSSALDKLSIGGGGTPILSTYIYSVVSPSTIALKKVFFLSFSKYIQHFDSNAKKAPLSSG